MLVLEKHNACAATRDGALSALHMSVVYPPSSQQYDGVSVGMARMRHTLQALQARAQAAMALAEGGAASLVQTLTGLLPPLANSGQLPKSCCSSITSLGLAAFLSYALYVSCTDD